MKVYCEDCRHDGIIHYCKKKEIGKTYRVRATHEKPEYYITPEYEKAMKRKNRHNDCSDYEATAKPESKPSTRHLHGMSFPGDSGFSEAIKTKDDFAEAMKGLDKEFPGA